MPWQVTAEPALPPAVIIKHTAPLARSPARHQRHSEYFDPLSSSTEKSATPGRAVGRSVGIACRYVGAPPECTPSVMLVVEQRPRCAFGIARLAVDSAFQPETIHHGESDQNSRSHRPLLQRKLHRRTTTKTSRASSRLSSACKHTQDELTSQNLWSRYVRHFVGITWHNVLS